MFKSQRMVRYKGAEEVIKPKWKERSSHFATIWRSEEGSIHFPTRETAVYYAERSTATRNGRCYQECELNERRMRPFIPNTVDCYDKSASLWRSELFRLQSLPSWLSPPDLGNLFPPENQDFTTTTSLKQVSPIHHVWSYIALRYLRSYVEAARPNRECWLS